MLDSATEDYSRWCSGSVRGTRAPANKLQMREKAHMFAEGTEKTDPDGRTDAQQP
jgi:hypothetical protein